MSKRHDEELLSFIKESNQRWAEDAVNAADEATKLAEAAPEYLDGLFTDRATTATRVVAVAEAIAEITKRAHSAKDKADSVRQLIYNGSDGNDLGKARQQALQMARLAAEIGSIHDQIQQIVRQHAIEIADDGG